MKFEKNNSHQLGIFNNYLFDFLLKLYYNNYSKEKENKTFKGDYNYAFTLHTYHKQRYSLWRTNRYLAWE